MKQNETFSDEILNAYIDGELSTDDELSILEAMKNDNTLLNRINDLKQVKKLVYDLYQDDISLKKNMAKPKNRQYFPLVASILIAVGLVSGWMGHSFLYTHSEWNQISEKKSLTSKNTWNIVLHVNSNDGYVQKTILDETENLLESLKGDENTVKVEIVAYGKGIFLFDKEKTKYPERLQSLKNNFSNLSYAVCGRTLKRIEKNQNRKINLITDMTISRSGIYQIIKRQRQGWNYIRI